MPAPFPGLAKKDPFDVKGIAPMEVTIATMVEEAAQKV